MRGRTPRCFLQTSPGLQRAYGDVPRDADIDREAMLRGELVRSFDCAVLDRTGSTDIVSSGRSFGAAGAEGARSHCRPRALSSRLAGRAARCWRMPRADLACGVRRRTNTRHRMSLHANL